MSFTEGRSTTFTLLEYQFSVPVEDSKKGLPRSSSTFTVCQEADSSKKALCEFDKELGKGTSCLARMFDPQIDSVGTHRFVVLSSKSEKEYEQKKKEWTNYESFLVGKTPTREQEAMLASLRRRYEIAKENYELDLGELKKTHAFFQKLYDQQMTLSYFLPRLVQEERGDRRRLILPYEGDCFISYLTSKSGSIPEYKVIFATYLVAVELKKLNDKVGVIHGDVKENNLLIYENRETHEMHVYLIDGGNSVLLGSPAVRYFRSNYGCSPIYHAPEAVLSGEDDSLKVVPAAANMDIYSFAFMLNKILNPRRLFSPEVWKIMDHALLEAPTARSTWSEIIEVLQQNLLEVAKTLGFRERYYCEKMIAASSPNLRSTAEGIRFLEQLEKQRAEELARSGPLEKEQMEVERAQLDRIEKQELEKQRAEELARLEKKRMEAERKRMEAERVRLEAERVRLEAERRQLEEERVRLEEEQRRLERSIKPKFDQCKEKFLGKIGFFQRWHSEMYADLRSDTLDWREVWGKVLRQAQKNPRSRIGRIIAGEESNGGLHLTVQEELKLLTTFFPQVPKSSEGQNSRQVSSWCHIDHF